jgi:dCMP deaminase
VTRPTWDETFLELCDVIAKRSKDENTKVGCVLVGPDHEVLSLGYNCFPRGVDDNNPARQLRPEKYLWFEHAERNAILNAARVGTATKGATCYIPGLPCVRCSRAMIQAGITEIVCGSNVIPQRWVEGCGPSLVMLEEAGVMIRLRNSTERLEMVIGEEWGKEKV